MSQVDKNLLKVFRFRIKTYQDYVDWVRMWRQSHRDLVDIIMMDKSAKQRLVSELRRHNAEVIEGVNERVFVHAFQDQRLNNLFLSDKQRLLAELGHLATEMYKRRAEQKLRLHNGHFPRPPRTEGSNEHSARTSSEPDIAPNAIDLLSI